MRVCASEREREKERDGWENLKKKRNVRKNIVKNEREKGREWFCVGITCEWGWNEERYE